MLPNPEASGGKLIVFGILGAISLVLAYLAPIIVLVLRVGQRVEPTRKYGQF